VIRNVLVGESSLESVTLSHPLHSSLQTQLHKLMRHLDVPWAEDNSERSMKNSVIAGTVLSSFPVIVLLRGCRDTWPQYERILLTNCQDFD